MPLHRCCVCRATLSAVLCLALFIGRDACAGDNDAPPFVWPNQLPNLTAPTWGGLQFWSDELVDAGWRIQRHALTGHCRLLDDQNFRHAWGSYEGCLQRLQQKRAELDLQPTTGHVVILLHGLAGWRAMMNDLADDLTQQGYQPVNVSYASTRRSLDDHAASLGRVIAGLEGATRIDFVAHSMGNLVVRRYLALAAATREGVDRRFGRMVMLAPPNQGASLARRFQELDLYTPVLGPSGQTLLETPATLQNHLATPPFEFAIIAGTYNINPLLGAAGDSTVTVEETKLAGARDFLTLPLMHGQFRDDEECLACIARFLQHGYLVSRFKRQPLPGPAAGK